MLLCSIVIILMSHDCTFNFILFFLSLKLIRFTTLSNTVESPVAKTDVDVKLIKIKKTESLLNNEVEQICTEIER